MYKLAPSLLAADFSRLGEELNLAAQAGAHYIHIDVMDGHFVKNITLGPPIVRSLRRVSDIVFDVHLMISEPEGYVSDFAAAGADIINFHVEACSDIRACIRQIRALGKRAALTVKPATPINRVYSFLDELDMVLIMSVEPGRGGQKLIPESLNKALELANFIDRNGLDIDLEMDGGIYLSNLTDVLSAGINVVVAGSAVFGAQNPRDEIAKFYDVFAKYEKYAPDGINKTEGSMSESLTL